MTTIIKPAEYTALSKLKPAPNNPRSITEDAFKKLTKSLESFSIMLEERPILARKVDGVILCGNMRFLVAKKLGMKTIPVKWIEGYTPEQERELVIRDNIDFGDWDFDLLGIDYDLETLQDWGLEIPNLTTDENFNDEFSLKEGEKEAFQNMTFILADSQAEKIKEAIKKIKPENLAETFGNDNSNGNALHTIIVEWEKSKK